MKLLISPFSSKVSSLKLSTRTDTDLVSENSGEIPGGLTDSDAIKMKLGEVTCDNVSVVM